MPNNNLILRRLVSPWVTPVADVTKGTVLTHEELDNNQIYLRGEIIYTASTSGTQLFLEKINGKQIPIDLSGVVSTADTFITGSTFNYSTYDLTLFRNDGATIVENLAGLASDVYVLSGVYNPNNGTIEFTNSTGGTFEVSGFTTGFTNYYTTGSTLVDKTLVFDRNDSLSAYTIDLTPIGQTGSTLVPLIYNQSLATPNNSVQPAFGTSTIDSGSTFSSILGGDVNTISGSSRYSIIGGGYNNTLSSNYVNSTHRGASVINGGSNNFIGLYTPLNTGFTSYYLPTNSVIGGGRGNRIEGTTPTYSNIIAGGENNKISRIELNNSYLSFVGLNVIGGGANNALYGYSSGIFSGDRNRIFPGGFPNVIAGGRDNSIGLSDLSYGYTAGASVIGGGFGNNIGDPTYNSNEIPPLLFGATSYLCVIAGGRQNNISYSDSSIIGGGIRNRIKGSTTGPEGSQSSSNSIFGGQYNYISGTSWSSIVGGYYNRISNNPISGIEGSKGASVINGGSNNNIDLTNTPNLSVPDSLTGHNVIGGGNGNIINNAVIGGFIGGGLNNFVSNNNYYSFIGGGLNNQILSGQSSNFIGAGRSNGIATSQYTSILGGRDNSQNNADYSFIGGGRYNNIITTQYTSILGGNNNQITGSTHSSIVGGGFGRINSSNFSVIIGGGYGYSGYENIITSSNYSTIGGGYSNTVTNSNNSIVGCGLYNYITNTTSSSIVGGLDNQISNGTQGELGPLSNDSNFIGGGEGNRVVTTNNVASPTNVVSGGKNNIISATTQLYISSVSFIGGGYNNIILGGGHSTIIGGQNNRVTNLNNVHIIGSNITAISANTTHVNNFNIVNTPNTDNSLNDLLVRDTNGQIRVRQASSFTGGTTATTAVLTTKFAITTGFTQDVTLTINHGFGLSAGEEYDIVVKLRDIDNNIEIGGVIDNFQANDVDITLSQTYANIRVVIIA